MSSHEAFIDADYLQWRKSFRRLIWIRGACWVAAAILTALLLAGSIDFLVRPHDLKYRWLLTLAVFGTALVTIWRVLLVPLRTTIDSARLARVLEYLSTHASGEHSLATQSGDRDPTDHMRVAASRRVAEQIRRRPSSSALNDRACRQPIAWLIILLGTVGFTASLAAQESWTAFRRIAAPWAEFAWPQYDWLVLVDSTFAPVETDRVIDAYEPLQWYVIDERGSPPEVVWLQLRRNDEIETRRLDTQSLAVPGGARTRAALIEQSIDESVEMRVVGGDDRHMPWIHIDVYHPPRVMRFKIDTMPPEYAGRERSHSESISGRIECLVGSEVEVQATFDQPLSSAWLIRDGVPKQELPLDRDGLRAVANWSITAEGTSKYQFEVVGQLHERESRTRSCEVVGISDTPPTIEVQSPPVSLMITELASVPVRFAARDDLAVDEVAAAYSLTMSADAESYRLSTEVERLNDGMLTARAIIEPLMIGATVGDRVSVWAEATDRFNLGTPHLTRSPVRTLSIVTEDDKLQELDARLDTLIEELQRIQRVASQSADALAELRIQIQTAGSLAAGDIEIARKLMFETQSAARDLYESEASILSQVAEMQLELDWNGLDSTEIAGQLNAVFHQLSYLQDRLFPEVLQELSIILGESSVTHDGERIRELSQSVIHAWQSQHEISRTLASVLQTLGEFRRFGSILQGVSQLRQSQGAINQGALRAAESTLGREWRDLTTQQQAELNRLAERQSQSAEVLAALVEELESDSPTSEFWRTTNSEVRSRIVDPQLLIAMQQIAEHLRRNDLGQAMPTQQAILSEFLAIEELLAGPRTTIEATSGDLLQTLASLSETLAAQRALLELLQQAEEEVDARLQSQWAEMQFELVTQAEQTLFDRSATSREPWIQAARRALARMRQAHLAITRGTWNPARDEQQEAVDDLEQSIEQLQTVIAEQRQGEVVAEMQRLPEHIQELIDRQSVMLASVREVDRRFNEAGQWNRELLRSVREVEQLQQELAEDAATLLTSLTEWPAFHFAIDDSMLMMHEVATRLERRESGLATQELQQQIIQRLDQVRASLHAAGSAPNSNATQNADDENATRRPDVSARLSQVLLLRDMQSELRNATIGIIQSDEDVDASLLRLISDRQRGLADLAEPLLEVWLTDGGNAQSEAEQRVREAAAVAIAGLTAAAEALDQSRFTQEAVVSQDSVIAALNRILEESQANSSLLAGQDDGTPDGTTQQTTSGDGQSTDNTAGSSDGGSTTATNNDETSTTAVDIEVQRAHDRDLAIDVWGHLPPRAQQQLQADFSAEFLPEYDDWIRRYYEALAEDR